MSRDNIKEKSKGFKVGNVVERTGHDTFYLLKGMKYIVEGLDKNGDIQVESLSEELDNCYFYTKTGFKLVAENLDEYKKQQDVSSYPKVDDTIRAGNVVERIAAGVLETVKGEMYIVNWTGVDTIHLSSLDGVVLKNGCPEATYYDIGNFKKVAETLEDWNLKQIGKQLSSLIRSVDLGTLVLHTDSTGKSYKLDGYADEGKHKVNLTTKEESNMAQVNRKSVKVELFDNDAGLPVEESLVAVWDSVVTEDSDAITIQEIISTGEVAIKLKEHNDKREDIIDEEILNRTGQAVYLRPIKLKHLTWLVDGKRVN